MMTYGYSRPCADDGQAGGADFDDAPEFAVHVVGDAVVAHLHDAIADGVVRAAGDGVVDRFGAAGPFVGGF